MYHSNNKAQVLGDTKPDNLMILITKIKGVVNHMMPFVDSFICLDLILYKQICLDIVWCNISSLSKYFMDLHIHETACSLLKSIIKQSKFVEC